MTPGSTMAEILAVYPGAQRTLFRNYHIGGCSSCAFKPEETLRDLCARQGNGLEAAQVLEKIRAGHEEDAKVLIEPRQLAELLKQDNSVRLLDVRSREEHEAVRIAGSELLTQPVMKEILSEVVHPRPLIVIDHQGKQGLDAASYFLGHGVAGVRCLRGGIDAWAREVEPGMRRYTLG